MGQYFIGTDNGIFSHILNEGKFEEAVARYTGSQYAVAAVNGTSALHICLLLAGVKRDEEVITQPVSFIATCNAIAYTGAHPVFVDVDRHTMGLSPEKLEAFLKAHAVSRVFASYKYDMKITKSTK